MIVRVVLLFLLEGSVKKKKTNKTSSLGMVLEKAQAGKQVTLTKEDKGFGP